MLGKSIVKSIGVWGFLCLLLQGMFNGVCQVWQTRGCGWERLGFTFCPFWNLKAGIPKTEQILSAEMPPRFLLSTFTTIYPSHTSRAAFLSVEEHHFQLCEHQLIKCSLAENSHYVHYYYRSNINKDFQGTVTGSCCFLPLPDHFGERTCLSSCNVISCTL